MNVVQCKEVCNEGVASSLLKLRSLEKTIIASLFHSGLHSGTISLQKTILSEFFSIIVKTSKNICSL